MHSTNIPRGKLNANPLLAKTTARTQCSYGDRISWCVESAANNRKFTLHNAHQYEIMFRLPPSSCNLKNWEFCDSKFWQGMGVLGYRKLHQSKTHPGLPKTSQYESFALSAAVWPVFQCQIMPSPNSTLISIFDTEIWGEPEVSTIEMSTRLS